MRNSFVCLVILFSVACARTPLKSQHEALRLSTKSMDFVDDLGFENMRDGLEKNIQRLEEVPERELIFGSRRILAKSYAKALKLLLSDLESDPSGQTFQRSLATNFDVFEVYGRKRWGEVFITSYYEPVISGSPKKTERFSQALYAVPNDMVVIRMDQFSEQLPQFEYYKNKVLEQKSRNAVIRGRLVKNQEGIDEVVPFYDRREIDVEGQLKSAKVLAWVDPIEAFFLHIQGSGVVTLPQGKEVRIGYAAQNGHPYVAIGAHLLDFIPKEEMSLQKIENHLRSLSREDAQEILNLNPSYVFFHELKGQPVTYFGTDVIPGRTIATDHDYFSKGALGFLKFEKPVFSEEGTEVESWQPTSRFVLDQDTGGAIRGGGRLDLFWGRGEVAKKHAGVMRNTGELYYFFPKPEVLAQLDSQGKLIP